MKRVDGTILVPGILTNSELEAATGRSVYGISSLLLQGSGSDLFRPVKWRRNAEHAKQVSMAFFAPDPCNFTFTIESDGYRLYPSDEQFRYSLIAICYPVDVSIDSNVDSEFDESLATVIAYKAAELAGISIRDTGFYTSIQKEIEAIGI